MVTYIVASIIVVLLLLYLLPRLLRRPPRYRRTAEDDLDKFFQALLRRGYNGGFMVIEAPNRKRFIQFSKYIKAGKRTGLQFDFPLAKWSETYYERLKKLLYDRGIDYEIEKTPTDAVPAFISVDLGRDLARAKEIKGIVLLEVFKLKPTDKIKIYLSNINPRDEPVDT